MDLESSIVFYLERSLVRRSRNIHDKFRKEKDSEADILDPNDGLVIAGPPEDEEGYWAGCPSVICDEGDFYLYYRIRGRRRGGKGILAKSSDGINFERIKEFDKADLNASSIEGASLKKHGESFQLYICYQDREGGRWKIGTTSSPNFQGLNPSKLEPISANIDNNYYHLKDPVTGENYFFAHSMSKLYVSSCTVHIREPRGATTEIQRITPDGLNIDNFRISSTLKFGNKYFVFYDWQPSILHTWEERSGLAITRKFKEFKQIENFESSRGTKSLRYIKAVRSKDEIFLYYEISTEKGGHELMMNKLRAEELKKYIR